MVKKWENNLTEDIGSATFSGQYHVYRTFSVEPTVLDQLVD